MTMKAARESLSFTARTPQPITASSPPQQNMGFRKAPNALFVPSSKYSR